MSLKTSRSPRRSSDGQVAHRAVVQAVGCHVEQARGVARLDGPLGDEFVGEVEVEEIDAHVQRVQYDAMADFSTRLATANDAAAIARVFSPSFRLLSFLPMLHTEEEDRWFIENVILKECVVTRRRRRQGHRRVPGAAEARRFGCSMPIRTSSAQVPAAC